MKNKVTARESAGEPRIALDEIVQRGAERMLAEALEAEVEEFLSRYRDVVDREGRRQIVRNGRLPDREILTGAGPLQVRQPRVRDRRDVRQEDRIRFSSAILPPYLRRSKNLDELIPFLYLRGISTGDFSEALEALVGPEAKGLSANVVTRLTESWRREHDAWNRRDLSDRNYVYFWADGIHFTIRLEEDRQCILVLMGATADGSKELIGILDGYRESEQSWHAGLGHPDVVKIGFGFGLNGLGKFVQDVRGLVNPAALLVRLRKDLPQGSQNPRAPSPTAIFGALLNPRAFRPVNSSCQLCSLSR